MSRALASWWSDLRGVNSMQGIWALASRLYVYASGFMAVFVLAANIPPERFGEYSIYQSVLELGLVVGTLGSGILFSRNAPLNPPAVFRGDVVRTLAIGLPLAGVLVGGMLVSQHMPLASAPFLLLLATLTVFSFNGLRLAYGRGLGNAGLLNLEAGLRSTVLLGGVGLMLLLHREPSVSYLLLTNLFAVLLVLGIILAAGRTFSPPAGTHALRVDSQAGATAYAMLMFVLKKSDLLVIAYFMPLSYVGAFKVAFVLAEAPSQFVQAYLYTRTSQMIGSTGAAFAPAKLVLARNAFLLGVFLFVGLGVVLWFAGPLLRFSAEARGIFLAMLPYFLIKTYTTHHELVLQLNTRVRVLGARALLEVAIKAVAYGGVILLFPRQPHFVFPAIALTDLLLYEFRMKRLWGFFPLARLLRPGQGGAGIK